MHVFLKKVLLSDMFDHILLVSFRLKHQTHYLQVVIQFSISVSLDTAVPCIDNTLAVNLVLGVEPLARDIPFEFVVLR